MVKMRKEWDQVKVLLAKENRNDVDLIQTGIDGARKQWQLVKAEHDSTVAEIEKICRKLHQYNQQLYVEGGQSKELVSIQQSIDQLSKRKTELEDKQLGNIEQLDQLEQKIANETCRLHRLDEQKRSRTIRLKQRQQEIKDSYQELKQRREELRRIIPSHMMIIYNDLVAQKKRPMAVLKEENCGGCGMAQTVLNVHALRKASQYTRCGSCGRILILETTVD
jgi:predicted  nucleic acid-binding Zn-ribbon protein